MNTTEPTAAPIRKRGGCLTAFVILMMIVNPFVGLYYLFAGPSVKQALPSMPDWLIPYTIVLSFANLFFAIGIWKWKKWGVFGFAGASAIGFLVNLLVFGFLSALYGLVGIVILAWLVYPVWKQME